MTNFVSVSGRSVLAAALIVVAGCQAGPVRNGSELFDAGRYREAETAYQRELAAQRQAFGDSHETVATTLNNLALLYDTLDRHDEAETYHRQSLAIREKTDGSDSPIVAQSLAALAALYDSQGRFRDAEPLHDQALAIREKALGSDHVAVAASLAALADHYSLQGRYDEAEAPQRRALSIREKALGADHAVVAASLNDLAQLLLNRGRYDTVEALHRRALSIREKKFGADHPVVAQSLANLAFLYADQGRYDEAVDLHRRSLGIWERTFGLDHSNVAASLNNLAFVFVNQGRFDEAAPLFERALTIWQKGLGDDHPNVAGALNNLAWVNERQGLFDDAERRHKQALAIRLGAFGEGHPDVAGSYNNLAGVYVKAKRFDEAEALYRKALAVRERVFRPDHPVVAASLGNLADLHAAQGRPDRATALHRRALAIYQGALGPVHPDVARSLDNLAALHRRLGRVDEALDDIRQATAIHRGRAIGAGGRQSAGGEKERRYVSHVFRRHISIASAALDQAAAQAPTLSAETFEVAQLAHATSAGAALTRMAARFAAGDDELARLVRRHQDAVDQSRAADDALVAAASRPASERDRDGEAEIRAAAKGLAERLSVLESELDERFPDYAELASSRPLSLIDAQGLLRGDEAMIAYLVDDERSYAWVVRRHGARLLPLAAAGREDLVDAVATIRSTLDPGGIDSLDDLPAFDVAAAHVLYQAVVAPAMPYLDGARHLILVPDGALQSLPFGVLVRDPPRTPITAFGDYRTVPWLARDYAMTTLPSVSSLRALRRFSSRAIAEVAFTGFGNPVLHGPSGGATRGLDAAALYRGAVADVQAVRQLPPLPETADELRAMASALGAGEKNVHLQEAATERRVKALDLSNSRILAFATHGLLAGELTANTEPALVLTPPAEASALDDGLLTAGEIAQLDLNAEWVILSACNTASGDGTPGAEGLSGLAKAFFYAGSRALLVSHWPVASDATVALTTRMMTYATTDPGAGRADALRRAMLALMDESERPYFAHPSFWAPFVVVGEGGARAGS